MARLVRFGVSIEADLLVRFEALTRARKYRNRSEALRDLMRQRLLDAEWRKSGRVAGAILLVYDHHRRELVGRLMDIQHDAHDLVISNQHVHLDHDHCLEVIGVKGDAEGVYELSERLGALKGVTYSTLVRAVSVPGRPGHAHRHGKRIHTH